MTKKHHFLSIKFINWCILMLWVVGQKMRLLALNLIFIANKALIYHKTRYFASLSECLSKNRVFDGSFLNKTALQVINFIDNIETRSAAR